MFQILDALLIRASTHPVTFDLPPWPDLTGEIHPDPVSDWLTAVWSRQKLAAAITAASPTLADQVERIRTGQCHDIRQLRRTVASTARYLLRMTGRSTPFALFAGVAPAPLGAKPAVRWGQLHQPVLRADGAWLAGVIALLEECPALLHRLPVMLNDLAHVHEDRVIVPFARPPATQGRPGDAPAPVDVSVRRTAAVAAVTTYARRPIIVADLIAKLCTDFPSCSASVAEAAIARLVRTGVLLTALGPPMTATDGLAHVLAQLTAVEAEAIPELTDTVQALMTIGDQVRSSRHGSTAASGGLHRALVEQMNAMRVGVSQPAAVDLRLDATITLPDTLVKHAREAAAALTRLTPYPRGLPAWQEYHAAFLERYGPGAVVPLLDVVNPEIGLGFPATYRGSDRTVSAAPLSERDRHLLRLAQQATTGGGDELSLDERTLTDLAGPDQPPVQAPPHVELFLQIHASDTAGLGEGQYGLVVSGAARAAGATTGRFLHLLDAADRDRFRDAYSAVATMRAGAVPVQLSFPPLQAASDHLACAPSMLPMVLSAGDCSDGDQVVRVEDVAVGGDAEGLFLVSLRHRLLIEPTVLNAVEFRFFSHPLARFLCELPRACAAVYMPFSWGAAAALPFLPRLRYRRTVLAPARWNLTAGDLPPADTPRQQWREALVEWRQRFRLADRVYLVEADNLLPLDLTEDLHQELLRTHLDRHGHARLDEAPSVDAYGWLDGHAHEVVIPLIRTARATAAPSLARVRTVQHDDGHLPGASPWLYAKLYTSADRIVDLVHDVPDLLATWDGPAEWWYLPYRDPDPHLRLRIRLPDADAYGPAAARVGDWAARLQRGRRLGRLQMDTYHPETGRYGHGPAMAAAEWVFAADSSAAVAELNAAAANSVPLDALAAASLIDIVMAFAGDTATAMTWLTTHLPKEAAPSARATHHQAVRLADPTQEWSGLSSSINAGRVLDAWQHRRVAVQAYRDQLTAQRDPWSVVPSLLHLHCIRLHGVNPDGERLIRKLTRAAALRWSALHLAEAR
ncbi:lantibiotic dehydratase [Salinispora arenicola]|uniref:lantibiotic dehydratase n=1 Tax=Salinispora arenicola TaxID=168697 RepID=UPI000376980C|nr:lantibiotic dehydratase [Salinispora arenicola]